jgi:hypothetical protein
MIIARVHVFIREMHHPFICSSFATVSGIGRITIAKRKAVPKSVWRKTRIFWG